MRLRRCPLNRMIDNHLEVGILLYHDYEKKWPSNYGSEMMTEKNKR